MRAHGAGIAGRIDEATGAGETRSGNSSAGGGAVPSRRLQKAIDREIRAGSVADLGGVEVFGGARRDAGGVRTGADASHAFAAAGGFPRGCGSDREARGEKPGRGGGAARRVSRRSSAIHSASGGSDGAGSTDETGQAAGGKSAGGGMRAWRKRRGTASGGRGAGAGDRERAGGGVRKRRGGRSGGVCGCGSNAPENGNRQAGDVRGGEKSDRARGRERAGDFREDDDGLGIGGPAGLAPAEKGAGIPGPLAARRRRAALHAGRDGVDVPQIDRGERRERRHEWVARSARAGDAAGAGRAGAAKRAQDFETSPAGGPSPARN